MSPSIRGPQAPPPGEFQGGPKRLDSAYSRPQGGRHDLEQNLASFIKAVHSWPHALKTPDQHPPEASSDAFARLEAIEDWTHEASKAAGRMESKVLWSLMALESRISQSQDEAKEAMKQLEDAPALLWQALQELQAQTAEVNARTETNFISRLETLEERVTRSQEESAQSRKVLEEIPALMWQALQELKSQSAEMAAQGRETVLKSLEDFESQVAGSQEGIVGQSSETEARVVRSLEAITDRVVSAQGGATEARRNLDSLAARLESLADQQQQGLTATAQLSTQIDDLVLPSLRQLDAQIVSALNQLETRTEELQEEIFDGRRSDGDAAAQFSTGLEEQIRQTQKQLEETPALLRRVLEELQTSSAQQAAQTESRFLLSLEALESRVAQVQQDNTDSRKATEKTFLLSLEAIEGRVMQSQQDSADSRKALDEIPSIMWQALHEMNPQWAEMVAAARETVQRSHTSDNRVIGSLETLETRVAGSLEALEARVISTNVEASAARANLDAMAARMEILADHQHETFQSSAQLASRLDDQVLPSIRRLDAQIAPALKQLEHRAGELQKESADGRRSVGDMSALFSKGLKELMTAERASAQTLEKNSEKTRQIRSELASKLQEIHTTIVGRVDSLEKKVDANVRTNLSNWERFLEALELLEHKFSSIMLSIEESRAQNQNTAKRSDERMLRALETLEGAIVQLQGGNTVRLRTARPQTLPERRPTENPSLRASRREERLVSLLLNMDPEPEPARTEEAP